jgi:PPOX class probable FMN-dependent enzyme
MTFPRLVYVPPMDQPFHNTRLSSIDELRTLYRQPSPLTANKERPTLDEATQAFVSRARFASVATFDASGNADVSPRGGPSGFIRVLDPAHIALADLGGNNRLDTLQNIIGTGRIGLMIVVPGQSETVRINGAAWLSAAPDLLAGFAFPHTPKSAIVVHVDTTYVHCAKAFRRGGMWDADVWAELADTPDGAAILSCQRVADLDADAMRTRLDEDYDTALAAEA